MFCPNCKNNISIGSDVCPYCGTNLKEMQSQMPIQEKMNSQISYDKSLNNYQNTINSSPKKPIVLIAIIVLLVIGIAIFGITKGTNIINKSLKANNMNENNTFLMPIDDVLFIDGKGTTITGRIERGRININDEIEIVGMNGTKKVVVKEINMFNEHPDHAEQLDSVGLVLENVERTEVIRGDVAAAPNTLKSSKKCEAQLHFYIEEELGKNSTYKISDSTYNASDLTKFWFSTVFVNGKTILLNNNEKINSGDTVNASVELDTSMAMEIGTKFFIHDSDDPQKKLIGYGIVTKIN